MFRTIHIENFKSIPSLDLELGRVTVMIGENGCGKSNILDAIAFGAAAAAKKLDKEFLVNRGIRVSDPRLMRSAFDSASTSRPIVLTFAGPDAYFSAQLEHDNRPFSSWKDSVHEAQLATVDAVIQGNRSPQDLISSMSNIEAIRAAVHRLYDDLQRVGDDFRAKLVSLPEGLQQIATDVLRQQWETAISLANSGASTLSQFIAFSPQINTLRQYAMAATHTEPLGIYGEGLQQVFQSLVDAGRLDEIKENLRIIDWFSDIEIIESARLGDRFVRIRDRYMDPAAPPLDQTTSNEGFWFLLFYTCLFMSHDAPRFFAIDNVDGALNPKLCARLMYTIVELAKKYDKQVICTTHNPALLDGLDLTEDDERLVVVYRDLNGHTVARRVRAPRPVGNREPVRLSEAFIRGYIGGLPNF